MKPGRPPLPLLRDHTQQGPSGGPLATPRLFCLHILQKPEPLWCVCFRRCLHRQEMKAKCTDAALASPRLLCLHVFKQPETLRCIRLC
jgi:hypothetical protein